MPSSVGKTSPYQDDHTTSPKGFNSIDLVFQVGGSSRSAYNLSSTKKSNTMYRKKINNLAQDFGFALGS